MAETNGGDAANAPAHTHAAAAAADKTKDALAATKDKLVAEKEKLVSKASEKTDKPKKKQPPGGYDPTPLPRRDPGYTVRFTFHRADHLPVADLAASSSDPYLTATLTADDLPPRHREDPLLVHRTRTVHGSTAPAWEEDWVVANVPATGFRLKCRLYDEDVADSDDRLGNVTVSVGGIGGGVTDNTKGAGGGDGAATDNTKGDGTPIPGYDQTPLPIRKHMGSKRAYLLKAITSALHGGPYTDPTLTLSIRVLGRSDAPGGRMYTLGPTTYVRHFSPMIGRLTHTKVGDDDDDNGNGNGDGNGSGNGHGHGHGRRSGDGVQRYDFQANEIQLQGPVPPSLYHRYVEFRPFVGRMFTGRGLRGRLLHLALHKQHNRVYNFSRTTEYGRFEPCSEAASLQFLKLCHFADGGRLFTYVLSLDGLLRFTETGREFGIDMLSKHTMHADVATYIAFSGEFHIRRRKGGAGDNHSVGSYQLVIDNDSGTYRPDKHQLPHLQAFLEKNFPGLAITALHWEDEALQKMKADQLATKKREGAGIQMVLNRSPTASSISSSDASRLSSLGRGGGNDDDDDEAATAAAHHNHHQTKKERAWDIVEDPRRLKELVHHHGGEGGE